MRPLILTALYPPAVGGAATYFGSIAPDLAQRDEVEQLTVLTERMPGQPRKSTKGKLRLLRYLPARVSLPRRRWLTHAATYVLTQAWFAARLPALAQREGVSLIHFHTRYRGELFYAVLQRCGVPVIADLRDKMTDPESLVGVADRLLCCGEGVQRFAIERGFPAERATLIPIPFTPPAIPSPTQVASICQRYGLEGPYLLFVGDMTYNKGVYDLLEAYQRWRTEHLHVQLALAGINREGTRFLSQVQRAEGATYLGRVPHRDVLALMRGAEIVALPSRSEGLPRVILEAVALGTRVICPPGIPEFERHLHQFMLSQVNVGSIMKILNAVWYYDGHLSPYPLSKHSVCRVVGDLVDVYGQVAEDAK